MLHAAQDTVSLVNYAVKCMMISSLVLDLAKQGDFSFNIWENHQYFSNLIYSYCFLSLY